jgi:hypothetical protein
LAKLSAYQEVINRQLHRSYWGIPNLLVVTVTLSRVHAEHLIQACSTVDEGRAAFLFQPIEEPKRLCTPYEALLTEPWRRSDEPSLCIADAV